MTNIIKTFKQITKEDISLAGGKGTSLGILTHAGIPVPPGFVITTEVYKQYYNKPLPSHIQEDILRAFDDLGAERVAVRSSATTEDSETASWAGQLETFLNVTRENLIENIKKCWDSLQTERVKQYAQKHSQDNDKQMAIIIQKMILSEVSGVIFTVNPVTKNSNEIMIEAVYGLGELLVQGMVTPYNYLLDKQTLEIISHSPGEQQTMLIYKNGNNREIPLSGELQNSRPLKTDDLKYLAKLALQIEMLNKKPQDIEWAKENGNFYILQSRPVTTLA